MGKKTEQVVDKALGVAEEAVEHRKLIVRIVRAIIKLFGKR